MDAAQVKEKMLAAVGNDVAEREVVDAQFDVTMTFRVKMPLSRARIKAEDSESLEFELMARVSEGLETHRGLVLLEEKFDVARDVALPPATEQAVANLLPI